MVSFRKSNSSIACLLAVMSLAIPSQVEADFDLVGEGLCQPAVGVQYSHIAKSNVRTETDCYNACLGVNGGENPYFRGFSHLGMTGLRSPNSGNCICHYDAGHLPPVESTGSEWTQRYDPKEGFGSSGKIGAWDGQSDLACYGYVA
eukprot:CAMPEP_0196163960 /NCGR_PEP_ID=MMETSP0911-20130528/270_1 /TAXON_ID=49265 /ORGANISM="Thalassiosira rotula, Strain GSO102" /LENGTH=145 /DNA_ID=CAMNT_0041429021 /DNA_START=107 /DNA_END=544 /DNA_ORIENTATION=-